MTEYAIVNYKRNSVTVEQIKETKRYYKKIDKKRLLKVGWGL